MSPKLTKFEVEARQEQILDRLIVGLKPSQIRSEMNMPKSTFSRYMVAIRHKTVQEGSEKTAMQIFGELLLRSGMRTRRLWSIALDKDKESGVPSTKKEIIAAINSLRDEDRELIRNCQILGILPMLPREPVYDAQLERWTADPKKYMWAKADVVGMLKAIDKAEQEAKE